MRILYTNVFTLAEKEPSENRYVDMFFIWFLFLKKFGGLAAEDEIRLVVDSRTNEYIQTHSAFKNFTSYYKQYLYDPPKTLLDGMKHKYSFAEQFQSESPGRLFLYMDVDVLTYKPLDTLVPIFENRIYLHTEEKLVHFAGTIMSSNYLANRVQLSDTEKEVFNRMGGFSAGFFGWHHESKTFSEFFKGICDKIQNDRQTYYTIEQPYFNEAVVRYIRENKPFYILSSERIGFNYLIPKHVQHPYSVVNYAGEPGNERLHHEKLLEAYRLMFIL